MKKNPDYNELITRFLESNLYGDELNILTSWINESYENRKQFDQYNELWQMSKSLVFGNVQGLKLLQKRVM